MLNRLLHWINQPSSRNGPELRLGLVLVVAGILLAELFSGMLWGIRNVYEYQNPTEETSGVITPAPDPDPVPEEQVQGDAVKVVLGSIIAVSPFENQTVLTVAGRPLLRYRRTKEGVLVDALVLDAQGRAVAQIEENQFFVSPQNHFRIKRPDRHTFAVVDLSGDEAFQLRYVNPRVISVTGVFRYKHHPPVVITKDALRFGGGLMSRNRFAVTEPGGSILRFSE